MTFRRPLLLCVLCLQVSWFAGSANTAMAQLTERQFYTSWEYEPGKERYVAYYYFKSNANNPDYTKQCLVHYPKGPQNQYVFYYNLQTGKYWGRCVTRHHAQHDKKVMVWNFAKDAPPNANWGPLTKGDPRVPGAQDAVSMKMVPEVPDPPQ